MSKNIIFKVAASLILIAAILYYFMPTVAAWIMVFSTVTFSVMTAKNPYPGKSIRGKRLFGFQAFACMLMVVSSYLMFQQHNEWVLTMIVAAFLLLYSSIVIPRELEREKNDAQADD